MKTIYASLLAVAFFAAPAFASGEHCVTRNIVANYTNGSLQSTQCFSSESNYKAPTPDKCKHETKRS